MEGQHSPKPPTSSLSLALSDAKPTASLPSPPQSHISNTNPFDFSPPVPTASAPVDLDGMTVMSDLPQATTDPSLDLRLSLDPVDEVPEVEGSMLDVPDSPTTAAFAPFITEIFGPGWRCPSPVVLHIGNPSPPDSTSTPSPPPGPNALCPIWKKSNELFGKVFSYRPGTGVLNLDTVEAGLLYLGIRNGWECFNEWMQSPALRILKSVDEYLFAHLPRTERLAVAYKSFKLLKVSARERSGRQGPAVREMDGC